MGGVKLVVNVLRQAAATWLPMGLEDPEQQRCNQEKQA